MSTLARPVSHGPSSAATSSEDRRFGGAFWVSVALHGSAVVLGLLMTLTLRDKVDPPPQVFELVAGDGNAYDATEATQGVQNPAPQMAMPTINSVQEWTPPTPVAPVEPTPVAPVAPTQPPVVKPEPIPNFKQQITSVKRKEERKADREIKQQRAEDAKLAKANYEQFKKEHGVKTTAAQRPATATTPGPRIDPNAARRGLESATSSGPGAGGPAAKADAGPALDRYFAMLRERLRANHEKPGGLSDLLSAEAEFTLAANGVLTGVRIVRSSGNADFDASVLEAFARVRSIGPRPDSKTGTHRLTFRMKEV
jgi:colicin import membrane protein